MSGHPLVTGLGAENWAFQSVGKQCSEARRGSAAVDCHLRHVLSKFFLFRFRAFLESLICCPPLFFPRVLLLVPFVPLVAAAAAASPDATSSVTSAPAPGFARPACVVAASSRLVAQSSGGWSLVPVPGALLRLLAPVLWSLSSLALAMWPPLASAPSLSLTLWALPTPPTPLPLPARPLLSSRASLPALASPCLLLPSPAALP